MTLSMFFSVLRPTLWCNHFGSMHRKAVIGKTDRSKDEIWNEKKRLILTSNYSVKNWNSMQLCVYLLDSFCDICLNVAFKIISMSPNISHNYKKRRTTKHWKNRFKIIDECLFCFVTFTFYRLKVRVHLSPCDQVEQPTEKIVL